MQLLSSSTGDPLISAKMVQVEMVSSGC